MSEQIHPGHKVLRTLVPEDSYRRMIVRALCGEVGEDGVLLVGRTHRVLVSHSILATTFDQQEQITEWINSI